jgi:hypothetical protein
MEDTEPKYFSATIKAEQVGEDLNVVGFLAVAMIGGMPGLWLMFVSVDDPNKQLHGLLGFLSVLGFFGGLALVLIGFVLGMILWFKVEDYVRKVKGLSAPFNQTTLVTIDENGLNIKGLGLSQWPNVLSIEYVPDASYVLFVHTTAFGKVMLHHDADTLAEVLNFYLSQSSAAAISNAQSSKSSAFEFRAVIFHWPTYFTWILAGYLVGMAVVIGLPMFNADKGFFKNMVGMLVCAPIFAYMIWTIPFWKLSFFAGKRTKAFDLTQDSLSSKDRLIDIDLHSAKISFHRKTGIGYALDFMSIKPQKGKRLDLLVQEEEMAILRNKFNELKR